MRRTWWIGMMTGVAGAVVLTTVTGLFAQGRAGGAGNIVCVDVVKVWGEYERQKDLTEEMNQVQQEMQAEAEQRQNRIDSLQATIQAMNTNDPTYAKKMHEMLSLQIDFKNWSDLMQAGMAREVGLWTKRVYGEIMAQTEEIAARSGYSMVFYREAPTLDQNVFDPQVLQEQIRTRKLLWAANSVDITQQVLDGLNTKYRKQPKTQMLQITP